MYNVVSKAASGALKLDVGAMLKSFPAVLSVQQNRTYAEHVIPDRLKVR